MPSRRNPMIRIGLLALATLALGLQGCAGSSGSRASYVQDHNNKRYLSASNGAIHAVRYPGDENREIARLTAGLSAHAMGRNDEAIVWLRPLAENRDDEIAGKAMATLGLIALEEGENRSAAKSLSRAAGKLTADDSAKAAMYAGDAYANLGSFEAARLQYRLAQSAARDRDVRREITARLGEGFMLQVGAFTNRMNAERARRVVEQNRMFDTLGEPIVLPRTDNRGTTLYLVQVGRFTSKQDAKAAQLRTGIGGIVTMSGSSGSAG